MAIPNDNAIADESVMCAELDNTPANTTPTAIPSGILCKVTAKISIAVFLKFVLIPSGSSESKCKCGIT